MVPVLIIFAMELRLAPLQMVQLFNLNFLSAKLIQLTLFSLSGAMTIADLQTSLLLLPAALLALAAGQWLRRGIDETSYRGLLRGVLWLMVVILVGRFFY
jgi:hypothetical protein